MVEYIGGPGYSCMLKAFSVRSPQKIYGKEKCLKKTKNPYTDHWNLLYIESPINSGFSMSKKFVTTFQEENEYQKQIYEFLVKKHPDWVNNEWVITGESYAGLGITKTSYMLHKQLGFNIKGVYAMVPVIDGKRQLGVWDYYDLLNDLGYINTCCDKCMCSQYFGFVVCLNKMCCGLTDSINEAFENVPLMMKVKKNKESEKNLIANSILNVHTRGMNTKEMMSDSYIETFVTSKLFHKLIDSKRIVDGSQEKMQILEKDPRPDSYDELSYLIEAGIQVQISVSEGDFILVANKTELVFKDVKFSFAEEFSKLDYKTEDDWIKRKDMKNLSFVRLAGIGHACMSDAPIWFYNDMKKFCEKCFTGDSDHANKNIVAKKHHEEGEKHPFII